MAKLLHEVDVARAVCLCWGLPEDEAENVSLTYSDKHNCRFAYHRDRLPAAVYVSDDGRIRVETTEITISP